MNFYSDNTYVWFDRSLPFTPEYNELIYVETEYNQYLNDFFTRLRLPKFCDGWNISYLPKISEAITEEHLKYMFPYLPGISMADCRLPLTYENILSCLIPESAGIIRQGLIEYYRTDDKGYKFKYFEIQPFDYKRLSRELFNYTSEYSSNPSKVHGISEYRADDGYADRFFDETERLSEEIQVRVRSI